MMGFLLRAVITAIGLWLATQWVRGVHVDGVSTLILGWTSSTSDAPPISTGTTAVNALAGVSSRTAAPAAAPSAVMTPSRSTRLP